MKSLSTKDIQIILETSKDEKLLSVLSVFQTSMNDWPDTVLTLKVFLGQIERKIQAKATKKSLQQYLKRCDLSKNAWNAESITNLLEVYQYYNHHVSLKELIDDVQERVGGRIN